MLLCPLEDRGVAITLTPAARSHLAGKGYDRVFGARPLARVTQRDVRDALTDQTSSLIVKLYSAIPASITLDTTRA
jgi:ATP-dependent Clp protease ATP-binding subunit ClpA